MTTLNDIITTTDPASLRPALNEITVKQLRAHAATMGLEGLSRAKKADVVGAIVKAEAERRESPPKAKPPTKKRGAKGKGASGKGQPAGYTIWCDGDDWGWRTDDDSAESDVWFATEADAVADARRHARKGHAADTTPTHVEHDGREISKRMLTSRLQKLTKEDRDAIVAQLGVELPKRATVREVASACSAAIVERAAGVPEQLHPLLVQKTRSKGPRKPSVIKQVILDGLHSDGGVDVPELNARLAKAGQRETASLYFWRLERGKIIPAEESTGRLWVKGEGRTRRLALSDKQPAGGWRRADADLLQYKNRQRAGKAAA